MRFELLGIISGSIRARLNCNGHVIMELILWVQVRSYKELTMEDMTFCS